MGIPSLIHVIGACRTSLNHSLKAYVRSNKDRGNFFVTKIILFQSAYTTTCDSPAISLKTRFKLVWSAKGEFKQFFSSATLHSDTAEGCAAELHGRLSVCPSCLLSLIFCATLLLLPPLEFDCHSEVFDICLACGKDNTLFLPVVRLWQNARLAVVRFVARSVYVYGVK